MMRVYLTRAVLFLLVGWAIARLLAAFAATVGPDNNTVDFGTYALQARQALEQAGEIEALAIGNSHTQAIDFDTLGLKGYQLWRPGSDLFENRYEVESYIPRLPQVRTVVMSISYAMFYRDNAMIREHEVRRRELYASSPAWRAIPGDVRNFALGKLHAVMPIDFLIRPDHWHGVWEAVRGHPIRPSALEFSIGPDGALNTESYTTCRSMTAEALSKQTIESVIPTDMMKQAEMMAGHPDLPDDSYAALVAIIEFLQARDIRIVFYTPPYWKTYNEQYDPAIVAATRANMERLQAEYGVEWYDFSHDAAFVSTPRYFLNSHHLNLCGARAFSAELKAAMDGYAPPPTHSD